MADLLGERLVARLALLRADWLVLWWVDSMDEKMAELLGGYLVE